MVCTGPHCYPKCTVSFLVSKSVKTKTFVSFVLPSLVLQIVAWKVEDLIFGMLRNLSLVGTPCGVWQAKNVRRGTDIWVSTADFVLSPIHFLDIPTFLMWSEKLDCNHSSLCVTGDFEHSQAGRALESHPGWGHHLAGSPGPGKRHPSHVGLDSSLDWPPFSLETQDTRHNLGQFFYM